MMIDGTILFAVGGVETVTRFEFFPSHKVLDSTGRTAVIGKGNVEQHLLSLITVEGNRHEIVNVVNGYFGVESLYNPVINDDFQSCIVFLFLYRDEQIALIWGDTGQRMVVTQLVYFSDL